MKKNLNIKLIFTVIILIYLIPQNIFPQILSELDFVKIDTLLFQKKYTLVKNLFSEKEKIIKDYSIVTSDTAEFNFIRARYLKLIKNFQNVESYNEDELDSRIQQFRNYKDGFTSALVGQKSEIYFNNFLDNIEQNNKLLALKNYNMASFNKTLYLRSKKKEIYNTISKIEKYIDENNFVTANTLLKNLEIESGVFHKKNPIILKFEKLRKKINEELFKINLEQQLYTQKYVTNHLFVFSIGAQFVPYSSLVQEDQIWYFITNNRHQAYEYFINKIELNSAYSFILDVAYYSISNLKFSLGFEFGRNNSSSFTNFYNYKSSFDIKHYSFQLMTDYLFRKNLGFRPYIGLGLKKYFGTREQITNKNYYFTSYYLISEEEKFNVTQILLNLGSELVFTKESNLVMQIFTTLYYNLNKSKIIGAFGVNFGVKIGYAI